MRMIRIILWVLVVVAAAAMAYLYILDDKITQGSRQVSAGKLGGEFNLTRQNGKPITNKDLLGKPPCNIFWIYQLPGSVPDYSI